MTIRPKYWTLRPLLPYDPKPPRRSPPISTHYDGHGQRRSAPGSLRGVGGGVSAAVSSCLGAPGLATPSDLARSVPDPVSLEVLIRLVLRDDDAPEGNALNKPDMPGEVLNNHKEAGKLRRLYAEARKLTETPPPTAITTVSMLPPPENAGPPKLTFEQMKEMKKAWKAN